MPSFQTSFPDGTQFFSDQDDINYSFSKVLGQDVRLMRANLEKPSYEQYWPDIDGLAQREKLTDETMPSQTFFDIAVNPSLDDFYYQPSARTLSPRAL